MSTSQAKLLFKKQRKLPIILQDELAECGHACIAMISNFLGHNLDLYALRKINSPSIRGINLLEIKNLFEYLGFRSRALKVPLNELKFVKCPAILHWNMNHFVVLKKVNKNFIIIHDPATGMRKCSMNEVSESFTGIALEVEKSSDFKKINYKNNLNLYDLVKTIKGLNKFILLLVLLSLSIEILSLLNPLFLQYVTDNVLGASDKNNLYAIASGFIVLLFIQIFTQYIRGGMVIYLTNSLTEQFASNVVRHLLKLPLDYFEKRYKGDLQSKFMSVSHIQKKLTTDCINTALDGLMIIINFMVMLVYSQILTLLVLFSLLLSLIVRSSSYHLFKKKSELSIVSHAKSSSIFLETLQGIIPIKSFLKEDIRFNTWRNCYINALNADIAISRLNVLYEITHQGISHIEYIAVVCAGAWLVLSNKFSIGMLMAFLAYRQLLINKTSSFMQNIFDYKLISIHLGRLSDILFYKPEILNTKKGQLTLVKGALSLKNIFFKYNLTDKPILNNINLHIKAGEKVVIIGSSGSGKSTLLKIMMGLLSQSEGEIYIDQMPIQDFGLKNYRNLIASVMQEDTLLSGSILDNIAFFDEDIDIDQIYNVAKLSYIHDFIVALPMGYETLIGEMGSTLSGGQKQRILLARALYKKPKILFLDEATSHLDIQNEKNINHSLKLLKITQIIIAHRIETIQMADRVLDLEKMNQSSLPAKAQKTVLDANCC